MLKRSSILDYQRDKLCPDIWLPNNELKSSVKDFIISSIDGFFSSLAISGAHDFIHDIWIGSSLASFFYKEDTDFDVKVIVDIDVFKKHNSSFNNVSSDDLIDKLISLGRESYWTTALVPDTYHALDTYFYSAEEATSVNLLKYDSLYSVLHNTWYKEPEKLPKGLSPAYVLNAAKQKADKFIDKLDKDILTARRDSIDFILLHDYLKTLDADDLKEFSIYYKMLFDDLNDSIGILLKDRNIIKDLRHNAFDRKELDSELEHLMGSFNYSDENIVFKLLQRYGYMRILSEVYSLYKKRGLTPANAYEYFSVLD